MDGWFAASKEGLRKLVEGKPKVFVIHELLSNAWDTGCGRVDITLEKIPRAPKARLVVEDDHPEGFSDLTHAWTLFADSERKSDPTTRGRFNEGEKLVLALCHEATITTTTGSVRFDAEGRHRGRKKTESGSRFEAIIALTNDEYDEIIDDVSLILARPDVTTTFNGEPLKTRDPITTFEVTLPTVIADEERVLRPTRRKTVVEVYEPLDDEDAGIYELGIPVVDTGDRYHVNVRQKVPLNRDRDNVPPSYLKLLRAEVLNNVVEHISEADATETWVTEAMGSKHVEPTAVRAAITKRFGEDSVVYDPSDREANHAAAANDHKVVYGSMLPKEVWTNVRSAEALVPAGQKFPTHGKDFASARRLSEHELTSDMKRVGQLARDLGKELAGVTVNVVFLESPEADTRADYKKSSHDRGTMRFNVPVLGRDWFGIDGKKLERVIDLIIHELGHHFESSHFGAAYHKALTMMAGRVARLALEKPDLFR